MTINDKFRAQEYSGATKTIMDVADLQRRMDAIVDHAELFVPELAEELKPAKEIIDKAVIKLYG